MFSVKAEAQKIFSDGFKELRTGKETDSFEVKGDTSNDQNWHIKTDNSVFVPIHMRLTIRAWLEEDLQGYPFPDCETIGTESEVFIQYLELTFDHPATGAINDERSIIGFGEGRGSDLSIPAQDLHRWDNVAWEQPNQSSEELKMYFSTPKTAIKIEGWTFRNHEGKFRKRVHLFD